MKFNLEQSHPEVYQDLNDVWSVRQKHLVNGYPCQYVYFLRCCLDSTCTIHSVKVWLVLIGVSTSGSQHGGHSVITLPMPIGNPVCGMELAQ